MKKQHLVDDGIFDWMQLDGAKVGVPAPRPLGGAQPAQQQPAAAEPQEATSARRTAGRDEVRPNGKTKYAFAPGGAPGRV